MSEPTQLDVLEVVYGKRDYYRSDEIANARAVIALFRASAKAAGFAYPTRCASGINLSNGKSVRCDRDEGHSDFHGARDYRWAD